MWWVFVCCDRRISKDKSASGFLLCKFKPCVGFFTCQGSLYDLWLCTLKSIFWLLSPVMKSRRLLCLQLIIMQHFRSTRLAVGYLLYMNVQCYHQHYIRSSSLIEICVCMQTLKSGPNIVIVGIMYSTVKAAYPSCRCPPCLTLLYLIKRM